MKPRAFTRELTSLSLAVSQPALSAESEPWLIRDTLTDGWFGLAEPLAARGVDFDLSTTAYYAGLLSGTGDQDFEWGGRADALLKVDTGKLGLWDGGGFHAHLESRFGGSADRAAPRSGGIWPPNTGVVLPPAPASPTPGSAACGPPSTSEPREDTRIPAPLNSPNLHETEKHSTARHHRGNRRHGDPLQLR
jgi:hypothetical protein